MVQKEISELREDDIESIDLFEIISILRGKIKILVSIGASITLVGIIYSLLLTPMYRSSVLMADASESEGSGLSSYVSSFSGLASLAGINIGAGSSAKSTALATVKSRSFILQFIYDNDLMPIMFPDEWNKENRKWKDNFIPDEWDAYYAFSGAMIISEDPATGLIGLSIEWNDPITAATIANNLVDYLNQHIRNQQIEEKTRSIQFLQEELKKTELVSAQTVLFNIIEDQTKSIMLANVRNEYAFKIIDPAVKPKNRFKPQRTQIVIISAILGGVLGIIYILTMHFFFSNKEQE